MKFSLLLATLVIFSMSSVLAEGFSIPIPYQKRTIGNVRITEIEFDKKNNRKLWIYLTASFPNFTRNLDQILKSKGNFKGCSTRIYWGGNTSVRNTGMSLGLSSRLRYEKWWCKKILGKRMKGRIFRDTKRVHWRLFINPGSIDEIKIGARMENILNFPNDLERLLRLRVRKEIDVPIPVRCGNCKCSQINKSLKPEIKSVNFSRADGNISLRVRLSILVKVNKGLSNCLSRTLR